MNDYVNGYRGFYLPDEYVSHIERQISVGKATKIDQVATIQFLPFWADLIADRIGWGRNFYGLTNEDPDIYFCFLESDVKNAFAVTCITHAVYCIVIPFGMMAAVQSFAAHMSATETIVDLFKLDVYAIRFRITENIHRIKPKEIIQRPKSDFYNIDNTNALTISALTFLVYHELTHILHGHLALLDIGLGISELERDDHPDRQLSRQTIEFDADCTAIRNSIYCFYTHRSPQCCRSFMGSKEKELKFAVIGGYIFLKILYIVEFLNDNPIEIRTHPDTWVRIAYLGTSIATIVSEYLGFTYEGAVREISEPAAVACEIGYCSATGDKSGAEFIINNWAKSTDDLRLFSAKWAELYKVLLSEKIGKRGLSPPRKPEDWQ